MSANSPFVISKGVLKKYNGHEEQVVIPDGVAAIARRAFVSCSMKSVKIPDSVTVIKKEAFFTCENLQEVWLPVNIEYMSLESFWFCENLSAFYYPGDFSSWIALDKSGWDDCEIDIDEFYCAGKKITAYSIPEGTKRIEDRAFSGCSFLKKILIPEGVEEIGDSAFARCTSLKEISIPGTVEEIGEEAFFSCSSLKSINIPESVVSIGTFAFSGCRELRTAKVPEALKEMIRERQVFFMCRKLKETTYFN